MIYLSICIPTYNRSTYLVDTINSIISEPEFINSNEVEIVVSDNCSTDDTEQKIEQFLVKYPSKIKYNKNLTNIKDSNFEKVLSLGSGLMLKLNNDTLNLKPGSLKDILTIVKNYTKNNKIPFFLNGEVPDYKQPFLCGDISSFISKVSFRCTWLGGFFIPKALFQNIDNFSAEAPLNLAQVDVLMRMLKSGNEIVVIPDQFLLSVIPKSKGGYNMPQVFLTNYFKILSKYFHSQHELEVFKNEKKKTLFKFMLPWLITLYQVETQQAHTYEFKTTNYNEIIKKEFSYSIYMIFKIKMLVRKRKTDLKFGVLKMIRR